MTLKEYGEILKAHRQAEKEFRKQEHSFKQRLNDVIHLCLKRNPDIRFWIEVEDYLYNLNESEIRFYFLTTARGWADVLAKDPDYICVTDETGEIIEPKKEWIQIFEDFIEELHAL